jgi:hypothetical protein
MAAGATAQSPELTFVEPEKLAVNYSGEQSDATSVWVKNTSTSAVTPEFSTVLQDSDGVPVDVKVEVIDEESAPVQPQAIAAGGVERYRVRFADSSKSSGQLVAGAKGIAPATVPLALGEELPSARGVNGTLVVALILALLVLIPSWFLGHGSVGLLDRLGGTAELDFTKSFASTLTGVGALLTTIIAATSVLPEETVALSKAGFIGLNLTFVIAIAIAAAISTAVQHAKATKGEKDSDPPVWKTEGYVLLFMVAAFITLWAVYGELWTICQLVGELGDDKGFTSLGVDALRGLLIAAGIAMFPYTYGRLKVAVAKPEAKDAQGEAVKPEDLPDAEPEVMVPLL